MGAEYLKVSQLIRDESSRWQSGTQQVDDLVAELISIGELPDGQSPSRYFSGQGFSIDRQVREVKTDEDELIKLTKTQFNILNVLSQHEGKVLTYKSIYEQAWGQEAFTEDPPEVKVHVCRIRKKFKECGLEDPVAVVFNVGYQMVDQNPKDEIGKS